MSAKAKAQLIVILIENGIKGEKTKKIKWRVVYVCPILYWGNNNKVLCDVRDVHDFHIERASIDYLFFFP